MVHVAKARNLCNSAKNMTRKGSFIPRLMRTDKKEEVRVQKIIAADEVRIQRVKNDEEIRMNQTNFLFKVIKQRENRHKQSTF